MRNQLSYQQILFLFFCFSKNLQHLLPEIAFLFLCVFLQSGWESDLQNMLLKAWLVDSIYHFYDSNVKNKIEPE